MIIQSIALVDQIDKDLNTLSMRLREWYSYIFPVSCDFEKYEKKIIISQSY